MALVASSSLAAESSNAVVPRELHIEPPTLHCLGFEWDIEGDDNRNARVEVLYRQRGTLGWRKASPLLRIHGEVIDRDGAPFTCGNLFAGSILDLMPGKDYVVKLTLTDPDGGGAEKVVRVRTRPVPKAFERGKKLHLYPPVRSKARSGPSEVPSSPDATPLRSVADYEPVSFTDLAAAYADAKPGDIILVHAGIHRTKSPHEPGKTDFLLNKPATAQRPIVIRGAGDGEAIFHGEGNELFRLAEAHHHHFENLTLRDAEQLIHAGRGEEHCVGLVVRGCKLEQSLYPIWALSGKCRDFYIADNVITGPAEYWTPNDEAREKFGDSHALWLMGQGHVVCHNKISRFWDGIDFTGGKPAAARTERNCAADFYNNEISECIDDAIEMDYGVHNIRVFRNFIHNVFMGISAQPVYGGPAYVWRNVVFNCLSSPLKPNRWPAGLLVHHNTFLCGGSAGRWARMWQNTQISNNLFLGADGGPGVIWTGTPTPATSRLDYNGWRMHKVSEATLIWWQFPDLSQRRCDSLQEFAEATGHERHGVVVDFDIFVKAQQASGKPEPLPELDLRLRENSVAVDAGEVLPNLNDGFRGRAPDLGAYEAGAPVPKYGPRR